MRFPHSHCGLASQLAIPRFDWQSRPACLRCEALSVNSRQPATADQTGRRVQLSQADRRYTLSCIACDTLLFLFVSFKIARPSEPCNDNYPQVTVALQPAYSCRASLPHISGQAE